MLKESIYRPSVFHAFQVHTTHDCYTFDTVSFAIELLKWTLCSSNDNVSIRIDPLLLVLPKSKSVISVLWGFMLSYSELNASNRAYFYYIVFGSYFCHPVFETLIKSASGTLKKSYRCVWIQGHSNLWSSLLDSLYDKLTSEVVLVW